MRLLIFSVLCLIAVGSARRSYVRPRPRPPVNAVQESRPSCWIVCASPPTPSTTTTTPPPPPPPPTTRPPKSTTTIATTKTTKKSPTRTTTKRPTSTPRVCNTRTTRPPPPPPTTTPKHRPPPTTTTPKRTTTTTRRPPTTKRTTTTRPPPTTTTPKRTTTRRTTTTKRPPSTTIKTRPPTTTTESPPEDPVECTIPDVPIPGLNCFNRPQQGVKSFSLKYIQQIIVDHHNSYRNMVAEGYVLSNDDQLPSASHMGAVSWDKDLARLAKALLSGATQPSGAAPLKYPNFGIVHSSFIHKPSLSSETVIIEGIKSWFESLEYLTEQEIVSYSGDDDCGHSSTIGSLAVILNERSTHIGCAAIQFCNEEGYQYTVMCAYSSRTIEEQSIFEIGPAASDCRLLDDQYSGLCAATEPYFY